MDKNKQPEIKIDAILLKESVFRRLPHIPEDIKLNISFSVNHNLNDDKRILTTELQCRINETGDPIEMIVVFVGVFSVVGKGNMPLEQFARVNAAATMIPYVREEIHSRFTKASLPNLAILAPINIQAILDSNQITHKPLKKNVVKKKKSVSKKKKVFRK